MNVRQMIELLQAFPPDAVVMFEGETGYDAISGITLQPGVQAGMPDEVILHPDMTPD
ncbi:hypothetical protein [Derxia gummosa]|uniref:Uncharacterized protein n=1 Tax=Derxia gummosa DSM 723 TaxID=1121388 RepID=A0A8B6XBB6_9BURK|nr:hypothetical protein [Derxia gummosa]